MQFKRNFDCPYFQQFQESFELLSTGIVKNFCAFVVNYLYLASINIQNILLKSPSLEL